MTVLAGLLIALAIGLTGIGGGVLTAPVLLLFLGMPAPQAVGTALVFVAIVKLLAAPVFMIRRQVNYRILAYLIAGGAPGAFLGSLLLNRMADKGLNAPMLMLLGATVVISASVNFLRKQGGGEGSEKSRRLPFISFPIGIEVGFSSAGAGALGSLALMHWTLLPAGQIVGTDVLFGLALSTSAGAIHLSHGGVDSVVLRQLLTGGIPGVLIGAWLASILPGGKLRKALSVWLIWLGCNLFYRGYTALWP